MNEIIISQDIKTLSDYMDSFKNMLTALIIITVCIMIILAFIGLMYFNNNSEE